MDEALIRRQVRRISGRRWPLLAAWTLAAPALGAVTPPEGPTLGVAQVASADTTARMALLRAIQQASLELAARRADLSAAEARRGAAGFSPPLALAAEIEEVPDGIDVLDAGSIKFELRRDFLPSGLRSARQALAETEVDRARAGLEIAGRALLLRADLHLTRAVASTLIARRLAAEDSLLIGAEETLRSRFGVGEARYVDVLRLRTERLRIQTERAVAAAEARVSVRVLRSLAGPDSAEPRIAALVDSAVSGMLASEFADTTVWPPLLAAPSVDSLLGYTGAVRLAAIEVARSNAAGQLLIAERRSQVSTSLGAQRFDVEPEQNRIGATLAFSVSLPFLSRASDAAANAAAMSLEAARAHQEAVLVSARVELASARERYEAARERLALYDAALLQGAREERASALAAYRSGQVSLLELLDFERALARAEIAQLQGRLDAATALFDLLAGAPGETRASAQEEFSLARPESAR